MPLGFIPNPKGFAELEASEEYRAGITESAEEMKVHAVAFAQSIGAPWKPRSGHEAIEVYEGDGEVWLVNTDYGGHLMEWGSKNNPPHAVLRRAAMAAGATVEEF